MICDVGNEAQPRLLPGNSPNILDTIHIDRHGDGHNQKSDYQAVLTVIVLIAAEYFTGDCCVLFV